MLAVLVKGRGADHPQLAAGKHRLEHVGGVHGSLGRTCADHRMEFVEKCDHLAFRGLDFVEDGLEPFLELAPVFGAGKHRPQVERHDPTTFERFGDVAVGDAAGEAFDDCGLADPGLADEHRVVFGSSRKNLNHAADLVVSPDDGVKLSLFGDRREVAAVLLEGGKGGLGIGTGNALVPTQALEPFEDRVGRHPEVAQAGSDAVLALGQADQKVLERDVFVAEVDSAFVGRFEDAGQIRRHLRFGPAVDLGQLVELRFGELAHIVRGNRQSREHRQN